MGRAWAPVLGRPSEKPLAREPSRGLARGKSVVTFEVDQPALGDDGDGDEAPEAKRSLFCPRPGSSPRRRELDATSRNDLLNAFATGQEQGDSTSLQRERSARARFGDSTHASRALREMIARPKISRNEWKMAEIGAFEVGNFEPFPRPGARAPSTSVTEPS